LYSQNEENGAVYDKDFGPTTLDEFKNMERFALDEPWISVPEEGELERGRNNNPRC
jgi:hypothetical protein